MRIRSIKPELWTDALTGEWDAQRTLFFIGLWQVADDSGRLRLDPRLIRAELDPFDAKFGGTKGIDGLLAEVVRAGRVLPYEVDGRRYGVVVRFAQHQVINKPTKSRLPPPPEGLREGSGTPTGTVLPKVGVEGSREQGAGKGSGSEEQGGSAEPVADAPARAPASPVILTLRCSGKGPQGYDVTEAQVAEWAAAFPGIDVVAEIRKSSAWQEANPSRRKTHRGMAAHLVSWLGRAQDGGRQGIRRPASPAPTPAADFTDANAGAYRSVSLLPGGRP